MAGLFDVAQSGLSQEGPVMRFGDDMRQFDLSNARDASMYKYLQANPNKTPTDYFALGQIGPTPTSSGNNMATNPLSQYSSAPTTGYTPASDITGMNPGSNSSGSFSQGSILPNVTTVGKSQTSAPSFYTDYLNNLASKGTQTADNSQFVGATDLQNQAFNQVGQNVGNYQPTLQNSINLAQNASQMSAANAANPYIQSAALGSSLNAAQPYLNSANQNAYSNVNDYMNPYIQSVVNAAGDIGEQNIRRNLAPQTTSGLVGSGQFGSSRGATALGDTIANAELGLSGQQASLLSSGYQNAMQASQADMARKLQAGATAGQLSSTDLARMLQSGATTGQLTSSDMQNRLASSQQMGNLASQTQALGLGDVNALSTLGGQQQTIAQNQQLFPMQQLTNASALLRGYTIPTSTTQATTAPGQQGQFSNSPLQNIMSLATLTGALAQPGKDGTSAGGNLISGLSNLINKGYNYIDKNVFTDPSNVYGYGGQGQIPEPDYSIDTF